MQKLLEVLDEHAAHLIIVFMASAITVLAVTAYLMLKQSEPMIGV